MRADRTRARDFAGSELMPGVSRSVLQERDRLPLTGALPGNGYRLMVDVMAEFGSRARVATWQLDVKRTGAAGTDGEWTIADAERISSVENIYRVSLSAAKQYAARDLKISAEDIDLTLAEGSVFVAEIDGAATARRDSRQRHGQLPPRRPRPKKARSRSSAAAKRSRRASTPRTSA